MERDELLRAHRAVTITDIVLRKEARPPQTRSWLHLHDVHVWAEPLKGEICPNSEFQGGGITGEEREPRSEEARKSNITIGCGFHRCVYLLKLFN